MRQIKITLSENGTIADLKQTPLFKGNRNGILTDIVVPCRFLYDAVEMDGKDLANTVQVGAITINEEAKREITGATVCDRVKKFEKNGEQFVLYTIPERRFPKEWTAFEGTLTLEVNVKNLAMQTINNKEVWTVEQLATTQTATLKVGLGGAIEIDDVKEASVADILAGRMDNVADQIEEIYGEDGRFGTAASPVNPVNLTTLDGRIETADNKSNFAVKQSGDAKDVAQEAYELAANALQQEVPFGTLYTSNMTNISSQLDAFINVSPVPMGATVVVVQTDITDGDGNPLPNLNWKYTFGKNGWTGYEIPPVNLANDLQPGIVKGSNDTGSGAHLLVSITNGEFAHIWIRNALGNYVDLCDYINDVQNQTDVNLASIQQQISSFISGAQAVGNALKLNGKYESALNVANSTQATQDSEGNIITQTYLTKAAGLTQSQADARYLSKQFGLPYFITATGMSATIPVTPPNGVQYQVESDQAGVPITIFDIEMPIDYQVEFTSANAFDLTVQLAFNRDLTVVPQVNVYTKAAGDSGFTFVSTATLDPQEFTEDTIAPLNLKSYFTFIQQGNIVKLMPGDLVRVELLLTFQDSNDTQTTLYCLSNYISSFTMTNIQTVLVSQGNAGAYTKVISDAMWRPTVEGDQFFLTIPQTEHKLDIAPVYFVAVIQETSDAPLSTIAPISPDANSGDVTIYSGEAFNGVVAIAGGMYRTNNGGIVDTADISISDPTTESPSGNALTQQAINQQLTQAVAELKQELETLRS